MCELKDFDSLKLLKPYRETLVYELADWHNEYQPKIDHVIENVIDIGAGCGESVLFFLNHGAKKVIAIEENDDAYAILAENFKNDNRVIPIHMRVDVTKMDVEGAERGLVVEIHNGMQPYKIRKNNELTYVWGIK